MLRNPENLPLEGLKAKSVNSLMIMCTYGCQLACNYCQLKQPGSSMPELVLNKAIDLLMTTASKDCQIRFWGGEPLLAWDLIKKGIIYGENRARQANKILKFMVTTNGLLLDREKLEFISKHPVEVMFSLDGCRRSNMIHRLQKSGKDIYDKVSDSLRGLAKSGIPYFVNMVVSPLTAGKLLTNLNFLKRLGVRKCQLCYQGGIFWPENRIGTLLDGLKGFCADKTGSDFLMNFCNECEPTMLSQELVVDTDGRVYFDAAIFMEKVFPFLRKNYFMGDVFKVKKIDTLYRSKDELFLRFLKAASSRGKKEIVLNNIDLGLRLEEFFKSANLESIKSNEHPALIPVISGRFNCQIKVLGELGFRTLFLFVNGPCSNSCIFCQKKTNSFSELFRLESRLRENLKLKLDKLCIIGNEPLLHPGIETIIQLSRKYGFKEIEIMTSGERLSDKVFFKKIAGQAALSFSLPIFSTNPSEHDYIVGKNGSFKKIISGLVNARKLGCKVFIHSNLIRQNIKFIKKLEIFVRKDLGAPFSIFPVRPKTSKFTFEQLMPSYGDIINELKGINSLVGFPLCITKMVQDELLKEKDEISDSMKLYLLDQKFFKPDSCSACYLRSKCVGLFEEYAKVYPLNGINPFSKVQAENTGVRVNQKYSAYAKT